MRRAVLCGAGRRMLQHVWMQALAKKLQEEQGQAAAAMSQLAAQRQFAEQLQLDNEQVTTLCLGS